MRGKLEVRTPDGEVFRGGVFDIPLNKVKGRVVLNDGNGRVLDVFCNARTQHQLSCQIPRLGISTQIEGIGDAPCIVQAAAQTRVAGRFSHKVLIDFERVGRAPVPK